MDRTTWEAFLSQLRQNGWQPGMENDPAVEGIGGKDAVADVAHALLHYWQDDPSLANYAHQLSGSGALFPREEDKQALMNALNRGYIGERQKLPPENTAQIYQELNFWRGLQSREGLAYFARLSDLFAARVAQDGVGPEMAELLQSRELDPQMRDVRRQAVDALRKQLPVQLNGERSPVKRLRLLLDIMTGIGGVRLVDEAMWQQAEVWVLAGAQVSADNYIALRNVLTGAMDGELLDHPREALTRIGTLLESMDKGVDFGSGMDAETVLTYWRGKGFEGLPDDALIRLYQNFLQKNPQGKPLLAKDLPLVEGRKNPEIMAMLQTTDGEETRRGKRRGEQYAADPADGRERRKSGGLSKGARWGAVALCGVILLLVVLILSDPNSGEKINQEREQRRSEEAVSTRTPEREEETPRETPEERDETTPSPSENSTPKPEESRPSESPEELEDIEIEGGALSEEETLSPEEQIPYEEPEGGEVPPDGSESLPDEGQ